MAAPLNRLNDYFFKWLFGREERKDILLNFLNGILIFEGQEELIDITLAERELEPDLIGNKLARLDILGKASDGSLVNIEVQIANQYDMDKRTLFYWARLYQEELQKGQSYKALSRTVTINVLDYRFLPGEVNYHSMYSLYEQETHHRLNRDVEIHFLELPKWKGKSTVQKSRAVWING